MGKTDKQKMEQNRERPHKCSSLTFDKGAKIIQWKKKKTVFSTNGAGTPGHPHSNK